MASAWANKGSARPYATSATAFGSRVFLPNRSSISCVMRPPKGRKSDALLPAQRLVIPFTGSGGGERTIEVLDEQVRAVLVQQGTGHAGRMLVPEDVTGLAQGRYAMRVQEGGATRISRIVRE